LSDADVRSYLTLSDLWPALKEAIRQVEAGSIQCAARAALGHGPLGEVTHLMAAKDVASQRVVTKLVDYDPSRPALSGRPSVVGIVTFMVAGEVIFLANAGVFTNIRTAAATALAVDLLASSNARVLTIFGAGPLAKEHAMAVARCRKLEEIRIVSLSGLTADQLAHDLSKVLRMPVLASNAGAREACAGADIVVTATSAVTPILFAGDVERGTLLAAIGSGIAERRELDGPLVGSADLIVVETIEAAKNEAGDLISANVEGYLSWNALVPISDILRDGRHSDPGQIVVYKSVGAAWQDLACASIIARRLDETEATRLS